ncbi:MAG: hypothetical protein ACQERC_06200 [Bacteroidota bacterium]
MKFIFAPLFFALTGLIFFGSSGCQDQHKKQHIAELDDMQSTLDSISSQVNDTNRRNTHTINMAVRNTIIQVKNNYLPDTINYEVAERMNDYKEIRKALSSNSGNYAKVKQAIPEVQQKIEDLKHDIENGVGNRDKYDEYIQFERKKIQDIKDIFSYYQKTNKQFIDRFDSLHPIVSSFADSLTQINNE